MFVAQDDKGTTTLGSAYDGKNTLSFVTDISYKQDLGLEMTNLRRLNKRQKKKQDQRVLTFNPALSGNMSIAKLRRTFLLKSNESLESDCISYPYTEGSVIDSQVDNWFVEYVREPMAIHSINIKAAITCWNLNTSTNHTTDFKGVV